MSKLGKNQLGVIRCLKTYGSWDHRSCSWVWDTHSNTVRILDSLVKRGVVTAELTDYPHRNIYIYRLKY